MNCIKKFNLGFLLLGLFAAKLWSAAGAGNMEPLLLLVIAGLSVLLILHAESNTSSQVLCRQGIIYIIYLLFSLGALMLMGLKESEWIFLKSLLPYNLWPEFLINALGAAVLEEIIFRKLLLRFLLKKMGRIKSIALSALIFYLFHFSTMLTIIISGIFYASVSLRWNSLILAIGVHTFYDFIGNMANFVEKVSIKFVSGLSPYQVLHGGGVLSHFAFIALYFLVVWLAALVYPREGESENKLNRGCSGNVL